ncbi:hypothetical protein ACSBR2_011357 [Camellia fascicularis]
MSDSGCASCCRCCFSFILTSGLTALFMWLSLRTTNPICSIQYFYVPALNKTSNSQNNTTIYFDLKLDNPNKDKGIYYDTLNLTLYYPPNKTFPIANQSFSSFYQGHHKNAHRTETVATRGVPWKKVVAAENLSTVFRVDLVTAVRFKILAWKTKKHRLVVGADVEVNDSGEKVYKKGIRLRSGAPERRCYRARLGLVIVVFTFLNLALFI